MKAASSVGVKPGATCSPCEACRANNGLGGSLRFQANLPRGKRLDVSKALREEILSLEGIPTITVHVLLIDCLLFFYLPENSRHQLASAPIQCVVNEHDHPNLV